MTTQGLEVVRVDTTQNLLLLKGSVPGSEEGMVMIRKSIKPPRLPIAAQPLGAKKKAAPQKPKGAAPAKAEAPPKAKAAAPPKEKG